MGLYIVEEKDIDNFLEVVEKSNIDLESMGKVGIALGRLLSKELVVEGGGGCHLNKREQKNCI